MLIVNNKLEWIMKEASGTAEHYEAPQRILSQGRYLNLVPPE